MMQKMMIVDSKGKTKVLLYAMHMSNLTGKEKAKILLKFNILWLD